MSRKKKNCACLRRNVLLSGPRRDFMHGLALGGGPRGRSGLHAGRDNLESTTVNNNSVLFIIYHIMMFGIMMFGHGLLCLSSIREQEIA